MENTNQKSALLQNIVIGIAALAAAYFYWDFVKGLLIFAFTLGILVAVHEWGHFIAARVSGVRVYEFAIGMGPRACTYWHKNGTDYTLHWLPIGGFVNLKGMQPEDPPTPDGVNGKRPAERALIYLGGPLMNMIFGAVLACTLGWLWGVPDPSIALVGEVTKKSEAAKMVVVSKNGAPVQGHKPGFQVGDRLLSVNDTEVKKFESLQEVVQPNPGKPVRIEVQRGKDRLTLTGTPPSVKAENEFLIVKGVEDSGAMPLLPGDQIDKINGESVRNVERVEDVVPAAEAKLRSLAGQKVKLVIWRQNSQKMEVEATAAPLKLEYAKSHRFVGQLGIKGTEGAGERVSFGESVQMGFRIMRNLVGVYQHIFSRVERIGENVSGPVGILDAMRNVDKLPVMMFVGNLLSLSFSLAVFNLFPIPVLDGGHMLLLSAEVIRRRRLDPKMQQAAQLVGLIIILTLAILVTGKDLIKLFG